MKKIWLVLLFIICIVNGEAFAQDDGLKRSHAVFFLPGLAIEQPDGSFSVNIDAWVFEKRQKRIAAAALASWMKIDLDALSPEQKILFYERTRYFRTNSESNRTLQIQMAEQIFTLPSTNAAGRVHTELNVGREWVKWEGDALARHGWIGWTLEAPAHPLHGLEGRSWVIPAEGVSIVSDIDDTIKISDVLNKRTLIHNTFLEPFQAVPGMAEWYQEMARNEQRAFFHYLSASPIQLYPALSKFLEEAHFPPGALHLRESTSWRTLYSGRKITIAHKKRAITRLLTAYPQRKFILIGDSGENDPEIYADIARTYPERILAIHIRNVTSEDRAAPRYQQTFAEIDPQIWHIRD